MSYKEVNERCNEMLSIKPIIFYVLKGRFHNIKRWCGVVYQVQYIIFLNVKRQLKHSF